MDAKEVQTRQLLDVTTAARYLGVTPRMVRGLLESRAVPFHKVGSLVRISTADLDAYLTAHRVPAGSAA
jgi:excisionase family DNA binding protein